MRREIQAEELSRRLSSGEPTFLLDVRQEWEHAIASLPGSLLVPLNELEERVSEVSPRPGELLVVYCHHGVRSLHAAAFLAQAGLPEAFSLAGGIEAWSARVDPTVPRY